MRTMSSRKRLGFGNRSMFFYEQMRDLEAQARTLAQSVAAGHGASATLDFRVPFHPVVNDDAATQFAGDICASIAGEGNVLRSGAPGTGSEDFSFMTEQVPGCYLIIGNGEDSVRCITPVTILTMKP